MMPPEKEEAPHHPQEERARGVYTITEVALSTIGKIEEAKTNYLISLSSYDNVKTANDHLLDILSTMANLIKEYFGEEELTNYKVDAFNIMDYITALDTMSTQPQLISISRLRIYARKAFSIYDYFSKRLNVALPTQKTDFFRKLLNVLYSTRPKFNYDFYMKDYNAAMSRLTQQYRNPLLYLAYALKERKNYNLDTNVLIIGTTQIGKSTLALTFADLIYMLDGININAGFVDGHIVWTAKQGFQAFKSFKNDIIIADEGYFIADKREAIQLLQVKYLQLLNALASKHNIVITLMQDYTDIDFRLIKKADVLILIYEQGTALVYAMSHSFPIIKTEIINTTKFEKNQSILQNKDRALYELKRQAAYIFEINFNEFRDMEIWNKYTDTKLKEQGEAIDRAKNAFEIVNRIAPPEEQTITLTLSDIKKSIEEAESLIDKPKSLTAI